MQTVTAEPQLTLTERDQLVADFERDGYVIMPGKLPVDLMARVTAAIDRISAERRAAEPGLKGVKLQGCVDHDAAFRELMCYQPALELAHDLLGPMFHLCQSNFVSRPAINGEKGTYGADHIGWHADGPRPGLFPRVDGAMGLHYLKFGYFLTDVNEGGSPLEIIRGSHRKDELCKNGFDPRSCGNDHVTLTCEAGTVVAFHQAQWHAAGPVTNGEERKNVYISYCPTWMKPLDRHLPGPGDNGHYDPVTSWLLHEWRDDPVRWWLPSQEDGQRLAAYARR